MPLLLRERAELTRTTATDTKSSCNIARVDNSVSHRDYENPRNTTATAMPIMRKINITIFKISPDLLNFFHLVKLIVHIFKS